MPLVVLFSRMLSKFLCTLILYKILSLIKFEFKWRQLGKNDRKLNLELTELMDEDLLYTTVKIMVLCVKDEDLITVLLEI